MDMRSRILYRALLLVCTDDTFNFSQLEAHPTEWRTHRFVATHVIPGIITPLDHHGVCKFPRSHCCPLLIRQGPAPQECEKCPFCIELFYSR